MEDEDGTDLTITIRAPPRAPTGELRIGHFLTYEDGDAWHRVRIGPAGLTIGRVAGADLVLAGPDLSRRHCRLEQDRSGVLLTDLGSTNGTFAGGRRIERPVHLRNGSRFRLASRMFRYEQRDEREMAEQTEHAADVRRAVDYVRAILPEPILDGPIQADWWFVPSAALGGDAFGYQYLDETHFAGFVLDVSGHGLGAALHAANVATTLRRQSLPGVDFRDPGRVAAGLNAMFPMELHNGLMLTVWYFVFDCAARVLRFCSAGHHPAYLALADGTELLPLWLKAPTIGMLPAAIWATGRADVPPDSRLYLFSDGAFEIVSATGQAWVLADLARIMRAPEEPGLPESHRLYRSVRAAARPGPLEDDFSALVFRFA